MHHNSERKHKDVYESQKRQQNNVYPIKIYEKVFMNTLVIPNNILGKLNWAVIKGNVIEAHHIPNGLTLWC